jgi:prepilin-type N-terminal cleavage/methylation domain-containing protein
MRRAQAGVTLVEVLIAVTLLSLLTLGMLFAMRIGLSSLAKVDDKLMTNRRVVGAQRLLENQLEGLMPAKLVNCGKIYFTPTSGPVMFQGDQRSMRLVSTFSLQQAWRGQPQILEMFVIPGDEGGVRLVVNETPYSPLTASAGCLGMTTDPVSGQQVPRFAPPQISDHTFVLADHLAYCRFSYLVKLNVAERPLPKWIAAAPGGMWPRAIRVEMAPMKSDPSLLQPLTVTAPLNLYRAPDIEYGDY